MHSTRSESRLAAAALLALALLAGCGGGSGGDGPPDQVKPAKNELTGIATSDGATVRTFDITAKGAQGPSRTNGRSGDPSRAFSVSTEKLGGPFMLASVNDGLYGVATAQGRANLTPLTTLLTIALFGQSGNDAFNDFGDASPEQIALINTAEIQRAQADATDFIENTLHVPVKSGSASFVTAELKPEAGDPMWDTIAALNARIVELGFDGYATLLAGFTQRQHQCRLMQLKISVGGATTRFCPDTTASSSDAADPGLVVTQFAQASGETLVLRVRGDAVLDLSYTAASGAFYSCSGAACGGLTLGTAALDTTRRVTLNGVTLAGGGANASATGTLATTVPNVALADLPCLVGFLHRIAPDGTVTSECTDNSTALFIFNGTGVPGSQEGASAYSDYTTNNISIVMKGGELVSITAMVPSADFSSTVIAKCMGAACRGVTIGAPTTNTNFGLPTDTRLVRLDGTSLQALDADGHDTGDIAVTLKAAMKLIDYSNVDFNYAKPDVAPKCDGELPLLLKLTPDDTPRFVYVVCPWDTQPLFTTPLDGGGFEISFNGQITIATDADARVIRARISALYANVLGEAFGCDGVADCAGIRIGAADANGQRRVTMNSAALRNVGFDGFASGPRSAHVDAAFDIVPAPF